MGSTLVRPINFVADQGNVESGVQAMKAGAVDSLTRLADDTQLFAAVDRALRRDGELRGQRAIDPDIEQRFSTLGRGTRVSRTAGSNCDGPYASPGLRESTPKLQYAM